MAQGIGEGMTFAIGVAISPVPIIAVILMLFSGRAKVNGPMFLAGWVVALAVVSGVAYVISDAGNVSTDSAAADGVSWAQIVFGVLFLLLAGRSRPAPGTEPEMPKWMTGIDAFAPGKALGVGLLLRRERLPVDVLTGALELGGEVGHVLQVVFDLRLTTPGRDRRVPAGPSSCPAVTLARAGDSAVPR